MSEHTKIPWIVKRVKTSCGYCFKIGSPEMVEQPHGGICLYDDETSLNPHPRGQQEANASLIVLAVNNHDRLKEALESAVRYITRITAHQGNMNAEQLAEAERNVIQNVAVVESGRWLGDTVSFDLSEARSVLASIETENKCK